MIAIVGRRSVSAVALASAWLVLAGPAWATSGGSSGTTAGATSEGGSSTDAPTTDTESASSSADTTGGCDHCSPNAGKVTIVSPKDGESVTAPFVAVVEIDDNCTCDGCTCSPDPPMYAQLFLDSLAVDLPCSTSHCEFNVFPTLGTHNIYVAAHFTDETNATSIDVHVTAIDAGTSEGGGPGPTGDPTTAAAGESTGTGPAEQGDGGCGCTAGSRGAASAWLAAALLLLGARRRRDD